jgi:hypothetical protein
MIEQEEKTDPGNVVCSLNTTLNSRKKKLIQNNTVDHLAKRWTWLLKVKKKKLIKKSSKMTLLDLFLYVAWTVYFWRMDLLE